LRTLIDFDWFLCFGIARLLEAVIKKGLKALLTIDLKSAKAAGSRQWISSDDNLESVEG